MKKIDMVRVLKKNSIFLLAFLVLTMFCISSNAQEDSGWTGNVNLSLGWKSLDDGDWNAPDSSIDLDMSDLHGEFGIDVDFKNKSWPVSLNLGYLTSGMSQSETTLISKYEYEGKTSELYLGAKKIFGSSFFHPYINGGISLTSAETSVDYNNSSSSSDDSSIGYWGGGGVYFTIANHVNLGANIRYSKAEVSLNGDDIDAGGMHYGLFLGYHW